jgi:UDP-N-acetylmuramate dehydrogenase
MCIEKFSKIKKEFEDKFQDRVKFNEVLAPYLAYQIGGPADILVFPKTAEELEWISETSRHYKLPITIIGTGTNLLVLDGGIRGIVISLSQAFKHIELISPQEDEAVLIRCGGGVKKADLLDWAIERGFAGLEFSAGVPGTLGGGIFMNAGTKYGSYADILQSLELYDFKNGLKTFQRSELYFGYREQTAVRDNLVVSMVFLLKRGNSSVLQSEVARIIAEREEKQPLDFPSCGSTFKNPTGFSAGRLIEKSGLKGLQVGGAQISEKHANFILNKKSAKASDILELIQIIKTRVLELFQVHLECEVIVLGSALPKGES